MVVLFELAPVLLDVPEFVELELVVEVPELVPFVVDVPVEVDVPLFEPFDVEVLAPLLLLLVVPVLVDVPVDAEVDEPLFVEFKLPVPVFDEVVSILISEFDPERVDEPPTVEDDVEAPPDEFKSKTLNVLVCLVIGWDSVTPCNPNNRLPLPPEILPPP